MLPSATVLTDDDLSTLPLTPILNDDERLSKRRKLNHDFPTIYYGSPYQSGSPARDKVAMLANKNVSSPGLPVNEPPIKQQQKLSSRGKVDNISVKSSRSMIDSPSLPGPHITYDTGNHHAKNHFSTSGIRYIYPPNASHVASSSARCEDYSMSNKLLPQTSSYGKWPIYQNNKPITPSNMNAASCLPNVQIYPNVKPPFQNRYPLNSSGMMKVSEMMRSHFNLPQQQQPTTSHNNNHSHNKPAHNRFQSNSSFAQPPSSLQVSNSSFANTQRGMSGGTIQPKPMTIPSTPKESVCSNNIDKIVKKLSTPKTPQTAMQRTQAPKPIPELATNSKPKVLPKHILKKTNGAYVIFEDGVEMFVTRKQDITLIDDKPIRTWNLKPGTQVAVRYTDGRVYDAVVQYSVCNGEQFSEEKDHKEDRKKTNNSDVRSNNVDLTEKAHWEPSCVMNSENNPQVQIKCIKCCLVFKSSKFFELHRKSVCQMEGKKVTGFEFCKNSLVTVDEKGTSSQRLSLSGANNYSSLKGAIFLHKWECDDGTSRWYKGKILSVKSREGTSKRKRFNSPQFQVLYKDDEKDPGPHLIKLLDDFPHDVRIVCRQI